MRCSIIYNQREMALITNDNIKNVVEKVSLIEAARKLLESNMYYNMFQKCVQISPEFIFENYKTDNGTDNK